MDRKLFGFLSGWQFTVLSCVAITTPGAVYAIATQAVSITDPNSGKQSSVDGSGRLSVHDPIAGFSNYPGNFVRIFGSCSGVKQATLYSPPSGKALIVKSVSFSLNGGSAAFG